MRASAQQTLNKYRRIASDFRRFLAQCVRRRVCIALVGLRHMLIDGYVTRVLRASEVAGNTLMIKEDLDRRNRPIVITYSPGTVTLMFVEIRFGL